MENTNWISIFFKEGKRIFVHGTDNYRRGIFRCDLTQDSAVLTMISVFVCVSLLLPCFPLYWFPFRQVFQTMSPSSSRCLTSPRQDPQKRNRSSFLQQCEQNPRSNSHWPELDHMLSHMLILQPITPIPRGISMWTEMGRCCKDKPYEVNKRRDAEQQKWQLSSHSCWGYIVIPATSKTRMGYVWGARHMQGSCLPFYPSQSCWTWLSFGYLHSSPLPTQSGSSQQPSFLHTFQLKSLEVAVH